ncbi:MAG: DUF1080 domain-containing protein [bacterium]|nr:DUF1080 domain-containing protein [bacterium]
MLPRLALHFVLTLLLAVSVGAASAADKPISAPGIGNPFFALCMDTHDAKKRTLEEQAALLKELGYDGCGHLWLDQLPERLKTLDAAGLRLFQVYLRVNIKPDATPAYDPRLKELLPLLKGRDTQLALLIGGGKPSDPAGDPRAVELVGEIAGLAADLAPGVRVALYPHVGDWLQGVDDAIRIAEKVNRPNVGAMFNLSHALKVHDENDIPDLLARARPRLFAVTINGSDRGAQIRAGRGQWITSLDGGSFDTAALLRTLRDLAYTGPIGLQCFGIPGDAREHLARSIQAWRRVSAELYSDEAGFKPIFNGKDMTGWAGDAEWWGVKDGCLTAQSTPEHPCKNQSYLMYRGGEPADFDLRAQWRLLGGNSGIQIRSRELPGWDTRGYQADMDDAGVWTGALFEHMRAKIAMRGEQTWFAPNGAKTIASIGDAAELKKSIRARDWNEYRIVACGNEITLYLNGVMMSRTVDDQRGLAARKGIIALQNHPGPPMKVEFKNIRLKEFPPLPY